MTKKLEIPVYELCNEHDFVVVKFGADIVVSKVVAIVPTPDIPERYFDLAGSRHQTTVRELPKAPEDGGFPLEVATRGSECEERIEATIKDMLAMVNIWQDPEAAARVFYEQP